MEISSGLIFTILILLVPIVISRLILESALKKLEADIKLKLLDAFSNQRKYSLIIVLPSLVVYILSLKYFPEQTWKIILGFGSVYLIFFILKNFLNYKKVKSLGAPIDYIKSFRMAVMIVFLGVLGFGIQIVYLYKSGNDDYNIRMEAWKHANEGDLKMIKHDYKGAIMDYSAAVNIDSLTSTYHTNLGSCWYYYGASYQAKKEWIKAISLGDTIAIRYLEDLLKREDSDR